MLPSTEIDLSSSISAKAINNNLNKTNKHVHHLNNSELGNDNVTVLILTQGRTQGGGGLGVNPPHELDILRKLYYLRKGD